MGIKMGVQKIIKIGVKKRGDKKNAVKTIEVKKKGVVKKVR